GTRDAAPDAPDPGGDTGPDRCHEGVRSGTRHGRRGHIGRLALGRPARGVRPGLRRVRAPRLRGAHGGPVRPAVTTTGTKATRVIGALALIGLGWLLLFGLVISPPDENQGQAVRMLYIHVPTVWLAYLAFGVTALGSILYLFPKTRSLAWD